VFGTDRCRSEPPCVRRRATWPNGEWESSTRRHMQEPVRPEAVLPDRALCLPTLSHSLIVNKLSLSLSALSLFLIVNKLLSIDRYMSRWQEIEGEGESEREIMTQTLLHICLLQYLVTYKHRSRQVNVTALRRGSISWPKYM